MKNSNFLNLWNDLLPFGIVHANSLSFLKKCDDLFHFGIHIPQNQSADPGACVREPACEALKVLSV